MTHSRSITLAVDGALHSIDRGARLVALASALVESGRFVAGLTVDASGRGRSWWWPMPAASDRATLLALLDGDDLDAHTHLADEVAELVDAEVRARLVGSGALLTPRRPGRRTVPEAWLHALVEQDPWLPSSLDPDRVRALELAVCAWVRSGVPATGRVRLCLRIVAPEIGSELADAGEQNDGTQPTLADELVSAELELGRVSDQSSWAVELLAQDTDEPSLIVSIAQLWNGTALLGETAVEDVLRALGHLDRLAPEIGDLLDEAEPVWSEVEPSVASSCSAIGSDHSVMPASPCCCRRGGHNGNE